MLQKELRIESNVVAGYRARVLTFEAGGKLNIDRPSLFVGKINVPDAGRQFVDTEAAVLHECTEMLKAFALSLSTVETKGIELAPGGYEMIGTAFDPVVWHDDGMVDDTGSPYYWKFGPQISYWDTAKMRVKWTNGVSEGDFGPWLEGKNYANLEAMMWVLLGSYMTEFLDDLDGVSGNVYADFDGVYYPADIEVIPAQEKEVYSYLILEKI